MKELGRADYGTKRKRRRREIFIEASQINENDLSESRHVGIRSSRNKGHERRTKNIPPLRGSVYFLSPAAAAFFCSPFPSAAAASSRTGRPRAFFTSFSILRSSSGWSFSVCLEFSRPWPRRSPL